MFSELRGEVMWVRAGGDVFTSVVSFWTAAET